MYNRETILKTLNDENYYIDKHSLDLFLHDWHIESIYEDETGLEFYDTLALDRIKRGISLKAQGYDDEQIISKLNRMEATVEKQNDEPVKPIMVKDYISVPEVQNENSNSENDEIVPQQSDKHFTLDVTSQTLQMLAEAVAKKISDDITNSDMATRLIEAGGYKKDCEILSKQVQDLLAHNKELSERIELLESKTYQTFWDRLWGRR